MPKIVNSPFVRRSFMRFRLGGVAALTIPRAWLRILGPIGGAPQILDPVEGENQTLAAFIRIQKVFDVRVADILKDEQTGRIFVVRQVQPEAGLTHLLHCLEIQSPIPDEFNAQSLEAFWAQTASGFVISSDGPAEPVLLLNSMPSGTLPSAAKGNYQLVSGDFDVWTRLRADAGSVGNVRHALLGARHPSSGLGCYVGTRDDGATGETIRLDEHQTATLDTTVGVAASSATAYYVRLKRTGSRFQAFYSILNVVPGSESDWIEIANDPATSFASVDDLRVGLFGYTNNSTQGQALWHLLRNWTLRAAVSQGLQPLSQNLSAIAVLSGDGFLRRLASQWQMDNVNVVLKNVAALQTIISDLLISKAAPALQLTDTVPDPDQTAILDVTGGNLRLTPNLLLALATGIVTFGQIPLLPGSNPTLANQATRKQYVDDKVVPFVMSFKISDPSLHPINDTSALNVVRIPAVTGAFITKITIIRYAGSHTTDGSVTFKLNVNAANIGNGVSFNNTNNAAFAFYTDDITDEAISEGQALTVVISARSGTVSEREVSINVEGYQKVKSL